MKKAILTSSFFGLLVLGAHSQQITGMVKDKAGNYIKQATLTLKKSADSSIVKIAISDSSGRYMISNNRNGTYFITCSYVGYSNVNSDFFFADSPTNIIVPDLLIEEKVSKLNEVTVSARKPIIEVTADRLIFNVEGTINENAQTALELLRKSPGITIGQGAGINLNGKNSVQVYIDDKPSPLTDKDLIDFLSTIQSSSINSIEIIANPSAKFDAAGNAGIINIKLKKNKLFGTNGSINAGYSIGVYSKYNSGFSLNYRNKKVNLYSNYNFNDGIYEALSNQYRQAFDSIFSQSVVNKSANRIHNFKAGADFTLDSKQSFGIMTNGALLDNTLYGNSNNSISGISSGTVDKVLITNNKNKGKRHNINTNINYRFADTLGHELNLDANYGLYRINSNQYQPNYYYNASLDSLLYSNSYNIISPTDINIYNTKADYEQNVGKGKIGIGAKFSYVSSTNSFRQFVLDLPVSKPDSTYMNDFNYYENINAFYVNYNMAFKLFKIQAGVRIENTNISANSSGFKKNTGTFLQNDSTFRIHYTNVFPSAAITINKNPNQQWSLTYSYRIDRPAYRDLNPFEFKIDDYTSRRGNTALQPQFTNSLGLSFLYHQSLTTTLNYSYVKKVFTVLWDTASMSKAFISKRNMSFQKIINLNISYRFQYKWYGLFANLTGYYTKFTSDFGKGRIIDLDASVFDANLDQTCSLGKGWSGQLTAYYTSPSIVQGSFKIKEQWSIDGGLQKTIFRNAGKLSLMVTDMFNTSRINGRSSFSGQQIISYNKEETRQHRISFSYRFGNKKVKTSRLRETGDEDEKSRSF